MSDAVHLSGADIFAVEIEEAERIGCRLQVAIVAHVNRSGTMAVARLSPVNARTRGAFRTAAALAGQVGGDSIEANRELEGEGPVDVALRPAIRSVLDKAREILA